MGLCVGGGQHIGTLVRPAKILLNYILKLFICNVKYNMLISGLRIRITKNNSRLQKKLNRPSVLQNEDAFLR